jgi:hypothetical protein
LQRPHLDDAAGSSLGLRLGVQPLKQGEHLVMLLLGEPHPRQHEVFALPRVARLVGHGYSAPVGPAGGLGDFAVGEEQQRTPHWHRVVQRDHLWAQRDPLGLADRLECASHIALCLPDPGK